MSINQNTALELWSQRRKAKYKNRKVSIDGFMFDSVAEGNRYSELKMLEKAGKITKLEAHKLIAVQGIPTHSTEPFPNPVTICRYEADFVYVDTKTGLETVEDVKGYRTKDYLLKRKMLKLLMGIEIREISRGVRKRRKRWSNGKLRRPSPHDSA